MVAGSCRMAPGTSPRMWAFLNSEDTVVVSGTVENQTHFYTTFRHVVLLSAPLPVLLERVQTRLNNPTAGPMSSRTRPARTYETLSRFCGPPRRSNSMPKCRSRPWRMRSRHSPSLFPLARRRLVRAARERAARGSRAGPADRSRSAHSVAADWLRAVAEQLNLLRCAEVPPGRPLATRHRPSTPKTTASLARFDVELAEALCVCDHVDRDDFAVDNPEGHGRGETRMRCDQDCRCAVDEPGVGIAGPVRERERLPRYATGPVQAGGGSAACCGIGANGDVGVEQVEQRSEIAVA